MKKTFLLMGFLFVLVYAKATIRTVSNNSNSVAQDSTINAALNHISNGDTILLQGGPNSYPSFTLNKKVTIIGPGWAPDRSNVPFTAKFSGGSSFGVGSSGTEVQGIEFLAGNSITIDKSVSINNIRLIRNHFIGNVLIGTNGGTSPSGTGLTYGNYVIEGNWFDNTNILGDQNSIFHDFIIQNNFVFASRFAWFTNTNNLNMLINHNLFYNGNPFYNYNEYGVYATNFNFTNNIFYNVNLTYNMQSVNGQVWFYSTGYCTFKNNITYGGNTTPPWTLFNNTDGGGNLNNTDPQINNLATIGNNPLADFTVTGGQAYNGGLDGKSMGFLYDNVGSLNWTNSRMSRIPYVYSFQILDPNVGPGTSVRVSVEARRQN